MLGVFLTPFLQKYDRIFLLLVICMNTTSSKKHPENTPSDDTKTPEVPSEVRDRKTSETSPDETITPPSGGHKIHPLWYVIIGLILLNFLTIYRYERRIDRLERVPIIQMRKNLPSPPPPVDRRERMEHMMQSQEDWMQAQTSKSYAGMRCGNIKSHKTMTPSTGQSQARIQISWVHSQKKSKISAILQS